MMQKVIKKIEIAFQIQKKSIYISANALYGISIIENY